MFNLLGADVVWVEDWVCANAFPHIPGWDWLTCSNTETPSVEMGMAFFLPYSCFWFGTSHSNICYRHRGRRRLSSSIFTSLLFHVLHTALILNISAHQLNHHHHLCRNLSGLIFFQIQSTELNYMFILLFFFHIQTMVNLEWQRRKKMYCTNECTFVEYNYAHL